MQRKEDVSLVKAADEMAAKLAHRVTEIRKAAEERYSSPEWREAQNITAGRHLTVAEMYAAAEREAVAAIRSKT